MAHKNKEDKKEYKKQWDIDNKEHRKQYDKNYRLKNKEKIKEYRQNNKENIKQYRIDNADHIKEINRQYRQNNKESRKQYNKQYSQENREHIKQYMKQYSQENKEHRNKYEKQKHRADLKYNLNHRMRNAIQRSLKGNKNGKRWVDLVGYTVEDLKKRLQSTMPEGYTWQDYMDGKLHIDHIIPISAHNFDNSNQIDFLNCWSLKNLQLLPAEENLIKGAKLKRPFQPTLKIAI